MMHGYQPEFRRAGGSQSRRCAAICKTRPHPNREDGEFQVRMRESDRRRCPGGDYFAMVMLGTPLRDTSVTVIWNSWYSSLKASRFHRASGPLMLTE